MNPPKLAMNWVQFVTRIGSLTGPVLGEADERRRRRCRRPRSASSRRTPPPCRRRVTDRSARMAPLTRTICDVVSADRAPGGPLMSRAVRSTGRARRIARTDDGQALAACRPGADAAVVIHLADAALVSWLSTIDLPIDVSVGPPAPPRDSRRANRPAVGLELIAIREQLDRRDHDRPRRPRRGGSRRSSVSDRPAGSSSTTDVP